MKTLTTLSLLALFACLQSCATPARSVAQEKKKNDYVEFKHHHPGVRHADHY